MLYMSSVKYTAPEMNVIEFGNEDVCTASNGWVVIGPDGNPIGGGGIIEENPDNPIPDTDF